MEDLEEVEELEELPSDDDLKNDESTVALATDDVQGLEEVEDLEEVEELEELPSDNLKGGAATVAVATNDVQDLEEVQELEEVDAEELPLVSMDGKKISDDGIEELEEVEDFEEVGIDDFISVDETPPPPRPKFEEVDDYIEPDEELFHSQSEEAEDRFKHISIGGLDFSYLDDKKDDESPSNLLELKNAWVDPPVPDGSPLIGELEVVGDAEPSDVESLEEDAIINKDGIYTISEVEKPEPSDMEFKNLVDSVINEA